MVKSQPSFLCRRLDARSRQWPFRAMTKPRNTGRELWLKASALSWLWETDLDFPSMTSESWAWANQRDVKSGPWLMGANVSARLLKKQSVDLQELRFFSFPQDVQTERCPIPAEAVTREAPVWIDAVKAHRKDLELGTSYISPKSQSYHLLAVWICLTPTPPESSP